MLSTKLQYFQKLIPIILVLILSSCNEKYSSLAPSTDSQSNSNKNITRSSKMKWSTNNLGDNGLQVYIAEELIAEFDPQDYRDGLNPIQQMLQEWNQSIDNETLFEINSAADQNAITSTQHADLIDYNDNVLAIYKHDDWFDDVSNSALAITQFFGKRVNTGTQYEYLELIHADIILNFKEFSFGISDKSFEDYDLPSVVLHELGHFLGLGHSGYSETSVMVPYLDVGVEKRELFNYDLDTINELYTSQNSSSLSAFSVSVSAMTDVKQESKEGEIVKGIIELQSNGDCRHFINGELVHQHKKKPGQL